MQPIPQPELLDAERTKSHDRDEMSLLEHRNRAQLLDEALHASCAYATELWQHLDATRHYLYESLPSDPRAPGTNPHRGASPTGPGDEPGWQRWIDTYATVTSILAGPHGDSGFGLGEARRAARERREAPNLDVLARAHTEPPASPDSRPAASEPDTDAGSDLPRNTGPARLVGLGLLVILAVRGLRRPRGSGGGIA